MSTKLSTENHPLSIDNRIDEEADALVVYQSEREKDVLGKVFQMFTASKNNRDRAFKYFDGRTLIEVINDSVGRFITNFDERDGIEDWQARVHVPMSAQKVEAVLGKVIAQLPIAQVTQRFDDDVAKAQILDGLYQFAEDIDDYEELMICAVLEGIVKGTVVGYEGYEYRKRTQRDIVGTQEDGTPIFEVKDVTESKLYGEIVPLEEFYPSSVGIRRIEDMPYCFRRKEISYSDFVSEYSQYSRYTLVEEKRKISNDGEAPFYKDYISTDIEDGNVEIIFYYNRDTDEYVIIANGVWLNPLTGMEIAPIPFNHKRLPFWSTRFSTLGSDFFYGKSLVDRISALQDVLNILTNMALDQSFLTIFPPVLTAGIDPIEEDYLRPGRRIPVDTQGLPLQSAFMKLDLGTPSGWHQWIIQYSKSILEEASIDQTSSGQAGIGGRTTAEEIRTAAAGVAAMLGVFGKLLNCGIKNKAALKTANILQFWTSKETPIISTVLGSKAGIFEKAFNVVAIENANINGTKRGKRMVAMYDSNESLPKKTEVVTTAKVYKAKTGEAVQIDAITGDYIRKVLFDIKLVPNPKTNETKEIQKALELEWAKTALGLFPNEVNKEELANGIAVMFGKDPAKVFKFGENQPAAPADGATNGPVSPEPTNGMTNNMVRGMMGGEPGSNALRDIAK